MRAVTAATAAEVLQMDRKAFDNMLLRIGGGAMPRGKQGVERRIPVALIEELMLTADLSRSAGIPVREAFQIAQRLLGSAPDSAPGDFVGSMPLGEFVQLGADIHRLRDELQERLEVAIESVVRRPRGRPRVRAPRAPRAQASPVVAVAAAAAVAPQGVPPHAPQDPPPRLDTARPTNLLNDTA